MSYGSAWLAEISHAWPGGNVESEVILAGMVVIRVGSRMTFLIPTGCVAL